MNRFITFAVATWLILLSGPLIVAEDDLADGSIRELVEDYVSERATAERRLEIAETLRTRARRNMLRPYVARAAVTEGERPHALRLATDLQLDGLFKKIKKEIDGPDEASVVTYLFTTQDAGATGFLYQRWEQKPTDSDSFKMLTEGFRQHLMEFATVEKFYKYTSKKGADTAKVLTASEIVRWQMNADGDAEADLERGWKEFSRNNQLNAKMFPMGVGTEVVPIDEFRRTGHVRKVGTNYQLLPGAAMEWSRIPDVWQEEVFFLKLRVRVMSGDGASLTIETETHAQGFEIKDGNWTPKGGGRTVAIDPDAWEEIIIFCQYDPRQEGQVRNGVVTIENKLTVKTGQFNGKLTRISVAAGEGSTVVVGNMHVQMQRGTKDPRKRR